MKKGDMKSFQKVLKKHSNELIKNCKVNQFGIGYKITGKKIKKNTPGIVIYVTKKQTEKSLQNSLIESVPKKIEGIPTDIIEIPGGFKPRVADDAKHRPFFGGIAIINEKTNGTGTLGLIVKRSTTRSGLYGLTNNHVGANEDLQGLNPPAARIGQHWTQPGAHGGGRKPKDTIARLLKWNRLIPASPGKVNYYDAAIGRIVRPQCSNAEPYEVKQIGEVRGMTDVELGDKVMKRGRTTRKRNGMVTSISQNVQVAYQGFPCNFEEQISIVGDPQTTPFSLGGDSGSVVVSTGNSTEPYKVNSLLFAGGRSNTGIDITIASPIKKIARDFKLII